jgi:hypothetical protein
MTLARGLDSIQNCCRKRMLSALGPRNQAPMRSCRVRELSITDESAALELDALASALKPEKASLAGLERGEE